MYNKVSAYPLGCAAIVTENQGSQAPKQRAKERDAEGEKGRQEKRMLGTPDGYTASGGASSQAMGGWRREETADYAGLESLLSRGSKRLSPLDYDAAVLCSGSRVSGCLFGILVGPRGRVRRHV